MLWYAKPMLSALQHIAKPRGPDIALPTRQSTGSGMVIYYPSLLSLDTSIRSIAFLYNESVA